MNDREALERADRLLTWMMQYIGQMAPGEYSDCYVDLNAHCIHMHNLRTDALHHRELDLRN